MNYKNEILKFVKAQHKEQIKVRRHIHQYPELSYQEYKTTSFLKEQMSKLGLKILPLKMKTGLLAELKGNHPGPTIAIRTDIDALPILEQTNLPFKSKINGCMHACGHDMHMATIWGTAKVLSQMKDKIHGSVR
ncbi:MAG: amidohydrolase, partial [Candidatus Zixiibacteriota bacterium]